MKKLLLAVIIIVLITLGLYYWFFLKNTATPDQNPTTNNGAPFDPFGQGSISTKPTAQPSGDTTGGITSKPVTDTTVKLPVLRHLSSTPIGGYMASTTASSTLVRYVDRGAGHIFEANSLTADIPKISNTTIPRVYDSFWNKNANAFVLRYMKDAETIVNFFGELKTIPINASSTEALMPYEVKGKFIGATAKEIAVSPKADRVFTYSIEDGRGTGYTSAFDESKKTKVFESPLTQVTIEWPEENTLTLGTKASGHSTGYFYMIDIKKPALQKLLGGIQGLTATMSPDAKKVIFSSGGQGTFKTSLLNIKDGSIQETVFKTIAEKCVWSKLHPSEVYCAVPSQFPTGMYPDAWYKGDISFIDQIWHLDTTTGEVQLIANLLNMSKELIDVINPTLDPKENFLYFMNKRDLTLWSLDLNQTN